MRYWSTYLIVSFHFDLVDVSPFRKSKTVSMTLIHCAPFRFDYSSIANHSHEKVMTLSQLYILSRRSDRARDHGEWRELDDRLFFGWTRMLVNTISNDLLKRLWPSGSDRAYDRPTVISSYRRLTNFRVADALLIHLTGVVSGVVPKVIDMIYPITVYPLREVIQRGS